MVNSVQIWAQPYCLYPFLSSSILSPSQGGVVLVSHDERLIRLVCKELWVCEGGKVRRVEGGFDEYRDILQEQFRKEGYLWGSTPATPETVSNVPIYMPKLPVHLSRQTTGPPPATWPRHYRPPHSTPAATAWSSWTPEPEFTPPFTSRLSKGSSPPPPRCRPSACLGSVRALQLRTAAAGVWAPLYHFTIVWPSNQMSVTTSKDPPRLSVYWGYLFPSSIHVDDPSGMGWPGRTVTCEV